MKLFMQNIYRMAENLSMWGVIRMAGKAQLFKHHTAVAMQEGSLIKH